MSSEPINDFCGTGICCPCRSYGCYIATERNETGSRHCLGESDSNMHGNALQKDDTELALYVGQTFNKDDEAYECYCNFAKKNGFSVRRNHSLGGKEHLLGFYRREYVCHRAGIPKPKAKVPEKERQRNRKSSRCKCTAKMMIFKEVIDGVTQWRITEFNDVHNHELLKENEVRFLPAYRNIGSLDRERISILSKARCTTKLMIRILELEKGIDPGSLSFTERDVRNLVVSQSYVCREDDAMEVIKLCKTLKDQDAGFCYDYSLDEFNKLEHIIWSFGDSIRAYASFGDVIVFDTTYRINRNDMPLGVWVGIDNHGNTIFFGCVLLRNEKTSSFQWALQKFLHFMGGKHPQTILTDQDLALTEAISIELKSKHAFCIWHIVSKLSSWFTALLGARYDEFKADFYRLYNLETVEMFEHEWSTMVTRFDLHLDRHIRLLFTHRASWALPYLRDFFFAGMTTTGRSESINSFLKKFLNSRTSLKDFVEQVGVAVSSRNRAGEEATMHQKVHNSNLKTCMPIEEHASTIFTPYAFKLLQDEMVLSTKYALIEINSGFYIVRHCSKEEGGRLVSWTPSTEEVFCTCKEFEFCGILCRHAIRLLVAKNCFAIPDKYLINRWRRESSVVPQYGHHLSTGGEYLSQTFHSNVTILQLESSKTSERAEWIDKELQRMINVVKSMPTTRADSEVSLERDPSDGSSDDFCIKNPNGSKTKGRPKNKRLTGGVEAAKKTRRCHVPNCGGTGHDSRNCPNKGKNIDPNSTQSPNKLQKGWK